MVNENLSKSEFVKEIEKVLRMTRACSDIELAYGQVKYVRSEPDTNGNSYVTEKIFVSSEFDIEHTKDGFTECVRLAWAGQSDLRANYQSIEGDSGISIIYDIIKVIKTMA